MSAIEKVGRVISESLGERLPMYEHFRLADGLAKSGANLLRVLSYKNPDQRCRYPYDPSPAGYCWSWAHHVDGSKGYEDMMRICPGCDCFRPSGRLHGNPEVRDERGVQSGLGPKRLPLEVETFETITK